MVAENVVRRLGDHLYHGGILRLDFSAGVVVVETAELVDLQELIRRADQALSAAKRTSSGAVRVWERGTDVERARSLDPFAGDIHWRQVQGLSQHEAADGLGGGGGRLHRSRRAGAQLRGAPAGGASRAPGGSVRALAQRAARAARRAGALGGRRASLPAAAPGTLRSWSERAEEGGSQPKRARSPERRRLRAAPRPAGAPPRRHRARGGADPPSPSKARTGRSSTPSPPRWRWPSTACGSSGASASASARRRSSWRPRSPTSGAFAHGSRLAYRSVAMESLLASARKVAHTDATVLITGESGTGKEMLAHTVHELSGRRDKPLVVVDCGAIRRP